MPFSATGGTITKSGPYTVHTFTEANVGTALVCKGEIVAEVLVVAGGGSGGGGVVGSGGGAGGVLHEQTILLRGTILVTVGAGGVEVPPESSAGSIGGGTIFGELHTFGGGYGASHWMNSHYHPSSGGSGGGGTDIGEVDLGLIDGRIQVLGDPGGEGIAGQGYAGGWGNGTAAWYNHSGGGGGGAGEPGQPAGPPGGQSGGDGLQFDISGTLLWYAGGGAGGERPNNWGYGGGSSGAGQGGPGGGGNGRSAYSGYAPYYAGLIPGEAGQNGVVIVRYLTGGGTDDPVLVRGPRRTNVWTNVDYKTRKGKVLFTWQAVNVSPECLDDALTPVYVGYRIYRSTDNINFTYVGYTKAMCWLDDMLTPGGVYHYKVVGVNDFTEAP